jgi:MFS family permease
MSLDLILLFVSLFFWGIGEGMFIYFQPIYLQQLGASTMVIAGVVSAFGASMMIAHIPAGLLADRIGRKPLLVAAWTAGMVSAFAMALARTLPLFVAGYLFYGLTAFVAAPLNSYVTAASGRLSPVRAMTLASAAYNLGAVIGPVTGGWIGSHASLRIVYFVSGGLYIVSTVILLFLRSQPSEVRDPESPPASLLTNTRFVTFLGVAFLTVFIMYLPQPLTPNFLQDVRHLSLESIGLLGSAGSLGNAVLNLVLGQFAARTGFLLAQVCVGLFSLLIWKGTGMPWYALGYFVLGGFRASRSLIYAQVRPIIHTAQMGLAYGVAETFNSLAVVLAPLLAGVLYTRAPASVFPVSLGLAAVGLVVSAIFAPREKSGAAPPDAIRSEAA